MNREKIGQLIGETGAEILTRGMASTGICCTKGQPLCELCQGTVSNFKAEMAKVADEIPDAVIARLADCPPEILRQAIVEMIEPSFRQKMAKHFVS